MTITEIHKATMDSAFRGKKPGRDCAWCRMSMLEGRHYVCKLNLAQDASTCPEFRDSRTPSSFPDWTQRVKP